METSILELAALLKEKVDLLDQSQLEQLNQLADLFLNQAPVSAEWDELSPESQAKFKQSLEQLQQGHLASHTAVQARMRAKYLAFTTA